MTKNEPISFLKIIAIISLLIFIIARIVGGGEISGILGVIWILTMIFVTFFLALEGIAELLSKLKRGEKE